MNLPSLASILNPLFSSLPSFCIFVIFKCFKFFRHAKFESSIIFLTVNDFCKMKTFYSITSLRLPSPLLHIYIFFNMLVIFISLSFGFLQRKKKSFFNSLFFQASLFFLVPLICWIFFYLLVKTKSDTDHFNAKKRLFCSKVFIKMSE